MIGLFSALNNVRTTRRIFNSRLFRIRFLSQGWHYLPIRIHKCLDLIVRDLFSTLHKNVNQTTHVCGRARKYLLESARKLLQQLYATCFELTSKQTSCTIILTQFASESASDLSSPLQTHLPNLGQLVVVLKEEAQVLVADVDVRIPTKQPVLFLCLPPPTEAMTVNLILDLIGRVVHVYTRIDVRRAHLCLRTLQSGKEFRV
jgi:hypothetical protein